jgi:hypothetical protein
MVALNRIEDKWTPIEMNRKGRAKITAHTLDAVCVSYALPSVGGSTRIVTFSIKMRVKTGEPWWHVKRVYHRAGGADKTASEPVEDEFSPSLKAIWESNDSTWRGLSTGATARPNGDVETLLQKIDESIRAIALGKDADVMEVDSSAKKGTGTGAQSGPGHGGAGIRGRAPMAV